MREGEAERIARVQAEEEQEAEEEEEDDDDDEDEDEEGEDDDDEEDEGEEEEEVDPYALPVDGQHNMYEDRYFKRNENLRSKFNEVELDSFMKILNIKPYTQWQDNTVTQYKTATVAYEDESQETDPYFHLIAEVERKHLEKLQANEFRRGTEVKVVPDARKAPNLSRR